MKIQILLQDAGVYFQRDTHFFMLIIYMYPREMFIIKIYMTAPEYFACPY